MPRSDQKFDIDEQSPLIAEQEADQDGDIFHRSLTNRLSIDDSSVESRSTGYLILLVLGICGLQIVWCVELSNGSPYLLSLGMSKALMAFVWLAGPLTGVLVQPYIGIISDRSRIRWGRRRPFMIAGTIGTVVTSLILSYAKEIVWLLGPWAPDQEYAGVWKGLTIALAAVMMWCLDFAINTIQAAVRAFIVDGAPAHQQESANAWASRIVGVGNILGYIFGYLNLPKYFTFFGNTQFKVLCVIASIVLCLTITISCLTISERNPQDDPPSREDSQSTGLIGFFKQVFVSITRLSPRIRRVCEIQFVHWLAYFPFLFYITTYIGQLYVNPRLQPGMTEDELDSLWAKATRVGTFALLIYAAVSFACNVIFPFLVVPSYKPPASARRLRNRQPITPTSPIGIRDSMASYREDTHHEQSSYFTTHHAYADDELSSKSTHEPPIRHHILNKLQIPGFTLRRAWMSAQILHALCMFSTFFIHTPLLATVMVSLMGITWSLTLWAPFAFISADIASRAELRLLKQRQKLSEDNTTTSGEAVNSELVILDDEEDRAGVILGLHNVAVSAPQVIATLASSVIFKFLQKDRGTPGDVSVAWTLRLGGIAALGAAFLTWRMDEEREERDDK